MNQRSYTVKELDDLRRAVEGRCLFGSSAWDGKARSSRQYSRGELEQEVEEKVRTHMLAGHTAQDLIDEDTRRRRPSNE